MPEVVFGLGKSVDHVVAIAGKLLEEDGNVLITRTTPLMAERVMDAHPAASISRCRERSASGATRRGRARAKSRWFVRAHSDIPVAEEARVTAEVMGNEVESIHDIGVAGIHRLVANSERLSAARVIIVVRGDGRRSAQRSRRMVTVPVIAVPTSVGYGASFHGLAALLGMLNSCSSNVTVVNIDNGFGAGYVASLINRL